MYFVGISAVEMWPCVGEFHVVFPFVPLEDVRFDGTSDAVVEF